MNYLFITALAGLILFFGGMCGLGFSSKINVAIVGSICCITGIFLLAGCLYIETF